MHLIFFVAMISLLSSPSFSKETAESQPVGGEQPTSSEVSSGEHKRNHDSIKESQEITHRIYTKDAQGRTTRITEIDYDIQGEVVDKRIYLTDENISRDMAAERYTSLKDSVTATEAASDVSTQVESSDRQYHQVKTIHTASGKGERAIDRIDPEDNGYGERETEK